MGVNIVGGGGKGERERGREYETGKNFRQKRNRHPHNKKGEKIEGRQQGRTPRRPTRPLGPLVIVEQESAKQMQESEPS
jgi:hypothetical protein